MASNQAPIVDRIRIIPRPDDFLDRNVGNSGEVFFDKQSKTLRLYSGNDQGGFSVLTNKNITEHLIDTGVGVVEYDVTVVSGQHGQGDHGNVYAIDGVYKPTLDLVVGYTYIFNQNDQTNEFYPNAEGTTPNIHPINFSSDNLNGERDGGTTYLTNVIYKVENDVVTKQQYNDKFAASTQRSVQITVTNDTPTTLYYWCTNHNGMGNSIAVSNPGTGAVSYNDLTDKPIIPPAYSFGIAADDSTIETVNASGTVQIIGTGSVTTSLSEGVITVAGPGSIIDLGISDGTDGQVLSTDGAGNFSFTDAGVGGSSNVFNTIASDDGSTTASGEETLNIFGGTNISTEITTDTNNVTVNLDSFSIDFLSDVDTTSSPPSTGQVLKWDGGKWAPGADATTGGAGTDADTLDGFDGSYYLDYDNFNNTPTILTLSALSIGNELPASGDGAISYNDSTGEFRYRPPTAAGIGALEAEVNDLTAAVVWANVPDANITQSSVLQHQSALSINKTQINGYVETISIVGDDSTGEEVPLGGTLKFEGASGATVAVANGTVTITASGGGGGEDNQNAFSNVAVSGQATVAADTTTDTLTLVGGSGITITTNSTTDSVTIAQSSTPVTTFGQLTDVAQATLDVQYIYEPAIAMLRLGNVGISAYTFNSHYSGNNPTITAIAGTTLAFDLSQISGHPFEIQDNTLTAITTNLVHVDSSGNVSTNSNAQGKSAGVLYWRVPDSISNNTNYTYQCQSHAGMFGTIVVKNL